MLLIFGGRGGRGRFLLPFEVLQLDAVTQHLQEIPEGGGLLIVSEELLL